MVLEYSKFLKIYKMNGGSKKGLLEIPTTKHERFPDNFVASLEVMRLTTLEI